MLLEIIVEDENDYLRIFLFPLSIFYNCNKLKMSVSSRHLLSLQNLTPLEVFCCGVARSWDIFSLLIWLEICCCKFAIEKADYFRLWGIEADPFGDALMTTGQNVTDYDLILSVLNDLGHKYDLVEVLISFFSN